MRWAGSSASSGTQKKISEIAVAKSTTASGGSTLFRDHVFKGGPADCRKEAVVQPEKREVAAGVVDNARTDAADDERDRERQEQDGQEQLPCACRGRHRGDERADGAEADVREQNAGDRRGVEAGEEDPEGRECDRLGEDEERKRRDRLADPDRAAVGRREHETVQDALFALGDPGAREPEQGGEDDRDPEQAEPREVAGLGRQREVEDDEGGDDEQQHRRQRVARPQLEQQILPSERRHVVEVVHGSASRAVARAASRSGACVATTNVASLAASSASRSSAPSASSALYGS